MKPHVMIALPVLLMGGTEMQVLTLTRVLLKNAYRVTVCCYYRADPAVVAAFRSAGADVLLLHLVQSGSKRTLGESLCLLRKLRTVFVRHRPNIVHVQYLAPGLLPILSARWAGVCHVLATIHYPGRLHGGRAKALVRLGSLFCSAFICVSRAVEVSWFGSTAVWNPRRSGRPGKHLTVYNGIDVRWIQTLSAAFDSRRLKTSLGFEGQRVVGTVGRLRREKGQLWLLETMARVVKNITDARLLVVGDGPDRTMLMRRASALGISEHVVWTGTVSSDRVAQLYTIMNVVAVPSVFEGFGLAAAEAMAAARPVIASDADGLREIVAHRKTGYLVPHGNTMALERYLTRLLLNPTLADAMGKAGLRRVERHFSLERFSEAIMSVYPSDASR